MLRCNVKGFRNIIIKISEDETSVKLGDLYKFNDIAHTYAIIDTDLGPSVIYNYYQDHIPEEPPYGRRRFWLLRDFDNVKEELIEFERKVWNEFVSFKLYYLRYSEIYDYFEKTIWRNDWEDFSDERLKEVINEVNRLINEHDVIKR